MFYVVIILYIYDSIWQQNTLYHLVLIYIVLYYVTENCIIYCIILYNIMATMFNWSAWADVCWKRPRPLAAVEGRIWSLEEALLACCFPVMWSYRMLDAA